MARFFSGGAVSGAPASGASALTRGSVFRALRASRFCEKDAFLITPHIGPSPTPGVSLMEALDAETGPGTPAWEPGCHALAVESSPPKAFPVVLEHKPAQRPEARVELQTGQEAETESSFHQSHQSVHRSVSPAPHGPLPHLRNSTHVISDASLLANLDVPTFSDPWRGKGLANRQNGRPVRSTSPPARMNAQRSAPSPAGVLTAALPVTLPDEQNSRLSLPSQLSSPRSEALQSSTSVADWMGQQPAARFPVQRPSVTVGGDLVGSPKPMQRKSDAVREEVEDLDYMKALDTTVASDQERERLMLEWLLSKYT